MAAHDCTRNKLLDATLKTLLSVIDMPAWLKAPGTFISELSGRFMDLPAKQQDSLVRATDEELRAALLQLDLATKHAAFAAAGTVRIEDQVGALRSAFDSVQAPTIIKFPVQHVTGDHNFVVGNGNIHIGNVDMRNTARKGKAPVIPGTLATDPYKIGCRGTRDDTRCPVQRLVHHALAEDGGQARAKPGDINSLICLHQICRHRPKPLEECLRSIRAADPPISEILLVIDGVRHPIYAISFFNVHWHVPHEFRERRCQICLVVVGLGS